jgi:DNA-binding GntR family transcriptional regulator
MNGKDTRFQNLSEFLFDKIAEKILAGKYSEGQKLIETEIMEEFSVSKSPVREALQGLMKVGLVQYKPRRGCYVNTISARDVVNHYIVRATVEGLAARLAYQNLDPVKLQELKSYYTMMKEPAEKLDIRAYLASHDLFHEFFAENSNNEIVIDFCKSLRIQNIRYRMQFLNIDISHDVRTHDDLIAHLESRDLSPEDYQKLMENHINSGLVNFQNSYAERN